ncbi:MAG: hypothetical protein FJY97_17925 [candidate division Zixibacteria bacterium]|nr:hypothetical protein [candidate division Zixibacteria bacterium]
MENLLREEKANSDDDEEDWDWDWDWDNEDDDQEEEDDWSLVKKRPDSVTAKHLNRMMDTADRLRRKALGDVKKAQRDIRKAVEELYLDLDKRRGWDKLERDGGIGLAPTQTRRRLFPGGAFV